ncbi:regulatory protein cys-3 [Trichosporon asahii var. asahii CBS 8904]|uniref:Regulatory protein cys-3 n=1 Tax=Trichosporon asahii var. asahii (strain CBS 8904) TaxID=1220162 RepID=K1V8G7_TRIAC|nr:regulatory protein cys-3 [Trichosporon asahii var. asahii CBS 8904]
MYSDLPPHLQTLNAIPSSSSPPSTALNAEQEEAFWSFLNTDELFANIGVAPQAFEAKLASEQAQQQQQQIKESPAASTPATTTAAKESPASTDKPTTLESFLANFADEPPILPNNYLLNLTNQYNAAAFTSTSTPAAESVAPETPATPSLRVGQTGERITGAKRLKQMGAPPAEIEEDKRRRNTEASARFRAKKKEREQALERRAKELEAQVANLTSEKASLEKENSLLKFILVNGGQGQNNNSTPLKTPEALQAALASLGKRKTRDE